MKTPKDRLAKQTVWYFWRHAWRYKLHVLGILMSVPVATFLLWFWPSILIAEIFNRITEREFTSGDLWGSFGPLLLLYAVMIFLSGVAIWRLVIFFVWRLERNVLRDIHREIFNHLMKMSANFHANRFGGSLVSQANKLSGAYVRFADTSWFQMYGLILSFIFSLAVLYPRTPVIATILIAFSVVFMFVAVKLTNKIRELSSVQAAAETKQTGMLADAITNVLAIKSFAGGDFERRRYAETTNRTAKATDALMFSSLKRESFFAVNTSIITVVALVFAVGGIVFDNADVGTAFLIVTYTGMISQRLWDFSQMVLRNYNRALGDSREMTEILNINPEVEDPAEPEAPRINKGEIVFKDMSFTHPDSQRGETLFTDLDLVITPGEKVGLVGQSGSGKTTLTKLLLRFNDIDGGEILIDGQNIANITQDDLRRHIAYVPQEPLLFHRSIQENIAYGQPDASEKAIKEAAEKAHALEFIERLPQKFETLVGERGIKLSGGQKQRVAIARAILKDAPILVLDEATSALDSESEKLIQAALWELMKGRTAIVIAHRLSTIQRMDRIIVLHDGEIIEQGSHKELLEQDGIYARLWAHQSGGFIEG